MKGRGYTLVELLVVMAITAALLAAASPSLQRQRAQAALRTAAGQTLTALHLARRLALARGQTVTVCATTDGVRCATDGRQWVLFANAPAGSDAKRDPDDVVLRRWTLPDRIEVGGTRGYAAFLPRPGAATTVTFAFRHQSMPGLRLSVIVSQTGRPRLERS